jgi:hypothetical protein
MRIHRPLPDVTVLADPFVGPDQRALEEMLASFEPVPAG